MRSRGFTMIELLVALGIILTTMALVYSGVRPQVEHAGSQVRVAAMQQGTRGAFDLFARDLRMAGYGVDTAMPGSPPPVRLEPAGVILYGNYGNVKTTGSGVGTVVAVVSSIGFATDNYLVIEGFMGGEAALIAGVAPGTVTLTNPLTRQYPAGSRVRQIETLRYSVFGTTLLRNGQPMADGVLANIVQYYLDDGTLASDPTGVEDRVRAAFVTMQTNSVDRPAAAAPEQMSVQAEVRIRNLGLAEVP